MSKRKKPSIPVPEEPKKYPSKKDKKRWCKGKVGIEHEYKWVYERPRWVKINKISTFHFQCVCQKCGKKEWGKRAFETLVNCLHKETQYSGSLGEMVLSYLNKED